jgi:two-component system, cell cycle response regulator
LLYIGAEVVMEREVQTGLSAEVGRVLVVDDSRIVRFMVASHLESAGFEVRQAENGAAALRVLAERDCDVVITDLRMPELDGLSVLSAVKQTAPDTEVIILTGSHASDVDYAVRALRLGAHDYLLKPPPSADAMVLTVQRAIEKKRLKEANKRLLQELATLSHTDSLTGLGNRRAFEDSLAREMARSRRHGMPLSLAVLDLDHFKRVNDVYGHAAGDDVLRAVAQVAQSALRQEDRVFRIGGEEFIVLLPHTELDEAARIAERLLESLRTHPVAADTCAGGIKMTASAGVAAFDDADADARALFSRADAALYSAKRTGRDRVRTSRPRTQRANLRALSLGPQAAGATTEVRAH